MSYYFEGNAYLGDSLITQSTIGNSIINTSLIDMNLENIKNVKDPVLLQDASTKNYVDNLKIIYTDVTLTNTTDTLIHSFYTGVFQILVEPLVANGPSAVFTCTKNNQGIHGHIIRICSCNGTSASTSLRLKWLSNNYIYMYKTDNSYNGTYRIKII